MNTVEPIVTAIDHYLSYHQIRSDIPDLDDGNVVWDKRIWETKDKLLKLFKDCQGVDHNLVSFGETNTLSDIHQTIGFYEVESYGGNYTWKVRRHKDETIPPTLGQHWYDYLGEPFPHGAFGGVVVLLSEEGVLFANEIARRIYDERLKNYKTFSTESFVRNGFKF